MVERKRIALDCDGVLLDYATAYANAWTRAFGEVPVLRNPQAYWPMERWGIPQLAGEPLVQFRAVFDEEFWSNIPAVSGALDACHRLVQAGYELVCVTALQEQYQHARERNLRALGFPIGQVIVTDNVASKVSPKAEAIDRLRPVAFVDDYGPYLVGVDAAVHRALILRDPQGSPNVGEYLQLADSTHADLSGFARWWISRSSVVDIRAR